MRILGIDPGYAILGYGIIDMNGNKFSVIDYGAVITDSKMDMPDRLKFIYSSLMEIIAEHKPETASIEELFFNNNAKTALMVGQARGVAILACINSGLAVGEYTPLQINRRLLDMGEPKKSRFKLW